MGHAGQKPVDIWGKNSLGQGGESSKCKGPAAEMCVICVSPCSGPTVGSGTGIWKDCDRRGEEQHYQGIENMGSCRSW